MIRIQTSHIQIALGALLLAACVAGCSGKSSTDRTTGEGPSTSTDPSSEEANVEVQQSGNAIVITGMNVSGECYDGCAKRLFRPMATMSDGTKATLTKVNYRKLGATGEPVWQFSGNNVSCDKDGAAAFAPICSSTNGSTVSVRVQFSIKTALFPNGLEAPPLTADISPNAVAASDNSGKRLYLFVTKPDFAGNIGVGGITGLSGGDYTCKTSLQSYLTEALGHTIESFAVLSASNFPLYMRINDATQFSVIQEETSQSLKFSRPIYSVSGNPMAPKISLIMPAGVDFISGLRQRTEDLIDTTTKAPYVDDISVHFLQGCNQWRSALSGSLGDSMVIHAIGVGGGITGKSTTCDQLASMLCIAIDP